MITKLYLIRHAESEYNKSFSHLVGGRSNPVPLSFEGIEQAHKLGHRLAKEKYHFDKIYSSTAVRAKDTAEISLGHTNHPLEDIIFSDQLLELNQGDWTGQNRVEMYTPEILKKLNADPWNFSAPHGESQKQVEERMMEYIYEDVLSGNPKTAIIYGHGVAFKCLLRGIIGSKPEHTYMIRLDNASISELECESEYSTKGYKQIHLRLVRWNDTVHLL
jgi:broad specificity phosphatase PhoE